MDEEKFRIKTYGFGELAQLYLPIEVNTFLVVPTTFDHDKILKLPLDIEFFKPTA